MHGEVGPTCMPNRVDPTTPPRLCHLALKARDAEALGGARQIELARKILESAAYEHVIYNPRRIIDMVSTE
jgi:hypothetical protein